MKTTESVKIVKGFASECIRSEIAVSKVKEGESHSTIETYTLFGGKAQNVITVNPISHNCGEGVQTIMAPQGVFPNTRVMSKFEIPLMLVIFSLGLALVVKKIRRP